MEYLVVRHQYIENLVIEVNEYLKQGWKLYGYLIKEGILFYQPMIREKEGMIRC